MAYPKTVAPTCPSGWPWPVGMRFLPPAAAGRCCLCCALLGSYVRCRLVLTVVLPAPCGCACCCCRRSCCARFFG